MHIIHGEQGDAMHSHHHEHEHGEGCCHHHGDDHCHEHDHSEGCCHQHDDDHGHEHDHGEGCCGHGEGGCCHQQDETTAVLTYMLQHNEHHAAELEAMAAELRKQGKTAAADMIDKGVVDFQTANMRLKVALSMLGEQA